MCIFIRLGFISVANDFWLGVQVGRDNHVYDQTPGLRTPLQVETNPYEKAFADGSQFDHAVHYNFGYLVLKTWIGPCLVIKRSRNFEPRDTACTNSNAFFCKWNGREAPR